MGFSLEVGLNRDGTIKIMNIGKKLSKADKKLITDKFPELENKKLNNELVFVLMAIFGSIFAGLQLWQIKRISDLCERVTRMETEIEHHFNRKHDEPQTRRFP